jgi:hypothetical protein
MLGQKCKPPKHCVCYATLRIGNPYVVFDDPLSPNSILNSLELYSIHVAFSFYVENVLCES